MVADEFLESVGLIKPTTRGEPFPAASHSLRKDYKNDVQYQLPSESKQAPPLGLNNIVPKVYSFGLKGDTKRDCYPHTQ